MPYGWSCIDGKIFLTICKFNSILAFIQPSLVLNPAIFWISSEMFWKFCTLYWKDLLIVFCWYHQITVIERFDQSKTSFNCSPHCCSNISYSMVWQAIFNLNIPYNLTLYALAHSWTSFEKSDSFWINSDKFHGNRGTFKKNHNSKYLWMQKLKKYLLG